MTAQEAIDKYIEMFGGYPYFMLMGASDEEIIRALKPCIEHHTEYECNNENADY